ncbi:uncharacterized protein LODBEIA_P45910 [Lodderomyces beijingensis]|uniref:Protein CASP n=1 Tax=Lodderomyces beijingensis TaxID=1775926 RepID=A0ABP0ZVA6_9ASCO
MATQDSPPPSDDTKSNVFERALQSWVEIDLPSLQKKLDEQGVEIREGQKDSLISRKALATKTKDFRKLDSSEKLEQVKTLLKLYQNEIDSLTTKNKNVENYFFGMYRLIAEAPDPRPLLELSLDSVIESREIGKLKSELEKTVKELSKKADYDKLKERLLSNEQKAAEILSIKLKAKESEVRAEMEEKEANWLQKQRDFENQLGTAQKQIEELRASKESTEMRLDNQSKSHEHYEGAPASTMAELDMVRRDAESARKRVYELEKRNESLRREIAESKNDKDIDLVKANCDKKISEMEGENVLLVANLNQIRRQKEDVTNSLQNKIEALTRENLLVSHEVKTLKQKLEKTADYEDIKNELYLLRQIEFGHGEEDEGGEVSLHTSGKDTKLDTIVFERNRAMTQELANFRSKHDDLISRINELEAQAKSSAEELHHARQLNSKLENDLADLQDAGGRGKIFNDSASLISGTSRMTRPGRNGSIASFAGDRGVNDESSILPIITKQRDRFREKNNEIEEELRKQTSLVNDMKRQINALKQDNEELYERGRYLQSFQTPGTRNITTTSSGRKILNPKPNADLEKNLYTQYQRDYEKKLHPIEQFRIKEQERINSRLSPLERMFISMTRAVLATRVTRNIFLAYCVGLHIMVMSITIYAMNLHTALIPEVGLNTSTGGTTVNKIESSN